MNVRPGKVVVLAKTNPMTEGKYIAWATVIIVDSYGRFLALMK